MIRSSLALRKTGQGKAVVTTCGGQREMHRIAENRRMQVCSFAQAPLVTTCRQQAQSAYRKASQGRRQWPLSGGNLADCIIPALPEG